MSTKENSFRYYFVIGALLIAVLLFAYFFRKSDSKPVYILPVYGPQTNKLTKSAIQHRVPDFSFTDQDGKQVTQREIENKIVVVDYFFTTCQSICPIMSTQMERVAKTFSIDDEILILSHTVNPETDSVQVLKQYAKLHSADSKKWKFLTGNKADLYAMARKGYLLNAEEGDGGEDDFIHTQNFALVDKQKRIRGFYDGTDSVEVSRLINDILILKQE